MSIHIRLRAEPPTLSDQGAAEMLDFLYDLVNAFENHYACQIQRHYQSGEPPPEPDPFDNFDDDLPPF